MFAVTFAKASSTTGSMLGAAHDAEKSLYLWSACPWRLAPGFPHSRDLSARGCSH